MTDPTTFLCGMLAGAFSASIFIGFALSVCFTRSQVRGNRLTVVEHQRDCAMFDKVECNCSDFVNQ